MRWKFYKLSKIIILLCIGIGLFVVFSWNPWEKSKVLGSFHSPVLFDDLAESHDMRYKIWYNVWRPSKLSGDRSICIVTQTSTHHLHYLISLVDNWNSDISVAVFVPGREVHSFFKILKTLVQCYPKIAHLVTIHAVLPLSHPPDEKLLSLDSWNPNVSCSAIESKSSKGNYASKNIPYPVNLLRNVALKYASDLVFVIDIDMLPSKQMEFHVFKSSILEKSSSVVVIPVFEIRKNVNIPEGKEELLDLWSLGKIRPFYEKACRKCQKYTDYEKWKSSRQSPMTYEVKWHDPWEPFYIAHKKDVIYDERFEQYGFNRISQLCHLHMAGFRFHVLRNAFLIHDGFKEVENFHNSKNEENERNKLLYRRMKIELQRKYGGINRKC